MVMTGFRHISFLEKKESVPGKKLPWKWWPKTSGRENYC